MSDATWTKRDGTVVSVKDMTDDHIRNCLRMLDRQIRRLSDRGGVDILDKMPFFDFELEMLESFRKDLNMFEDELETRYGNHMDKDELCVP